VKPFAWLVLVIGVAAAAAYGGYWYGQHHGAAAEVKGADAAAAGTEPAADKPVVTVATAPLKREPISETFSVYGTVTAPPGEVRALSVPFESHVVRVLVTPGQQVTAGTGIIQVEAGPDALVALQEAKNAFDVATRDLNQVQQRFADHLATNQELSQAQQLVQSAKLKLESLVQRGVGQSHELKAPATGLVSKVDVQEGQIVPSGNPLVEWVAGNRIEVRLGVGPDDAKSLKVGQPVRLRRVGRSSSEEAFEGQVRVVGQRLDPATRMVDVMVSPPPDAGFLLDSYVEGEMTKATEIAFVVPRDAALPDEAGHYMLFTVRDGHAVKHSVRLGLQNDRFVQVIGDDLKEGEPVVVVGNYQLQDGTAVEIQEPATQPAAEPATGTTAAPATSPAAVPATMEAKS
jgi:RND family efflux transporter MFP subunit